MSKKGKLPSFDKSPENLERMLDDVKKLLEEDGKFYDVSFHVYSHKPFPFKFLLRRYRTSDDYPELSLISNRELKPLLRQVKGFDERYRTYNYILQHLRKRTIETYNKYGKYGEFDPLMERLSHLALDYMDRKQEFSREDIKWLRPMVFKFTNKEAYGYDDRLKELRILRHFLAYGIIDPKYNVTSLKALKKIPKDKEFIVNPEVDRRKRNGFSLHRGLLK